MPLARSGHRRKLGNYQGMRRQFGAPPQLADDARCSVWGAAIDEGGLFGRRRIAVLTGVVLHAVVVLHVVSATSRRRTAAVGKRRHHEHRVWADYHVDRVAVLVFRTDQERAGHDLNVREAVVLQFCSDFLGKGLRILGCLSGVRPSLVCVRGAEVDCA